MDKNNTAILVLSDVPWETPWSSRKRIAEGLVHDGWNVCYSTGPLNLWNRGTPSWNKAPFSRHIESDNGMLLDVPGKLLSIWPSKPKYDHLIHLLYSAALKRQLLKYTNAKKLAVICFHPRYEKLVSALNPDYLVYFVYDDLEKSPGWNSSLAGSEQKILSKCHLLMGYSNEMMERIKKKTKAPSRALELAVDYQLFNKNINTPAPQDLSKIPNPRLGWTGNINHKIDFELLLQIAKEKPELNFVFIGKECVNDKGEFFDNGNAHLLWRELKALGNVHYLGLKHHNDIPKYVANMTINIMPYNLTSGLWVLNGYPLKMHEYLAVGKPVISADLKTVRPFNTVIDIATSKKQWISMIEHNLTETAQSNIEGRLKVAKENDWSTRIESLTLWLKEL